MNEPVEIIDLEPVTGYGPLLPVRRILRWVTGLRAGPVSLDSLAGFTVHAGWGNDGSADLSMRHDHCGWWLDDEAIPDAVAPKVHSHPFEGSAPLAALAGQALTHTADCRKR